MSHHLQIGWLVVDTVKIVILGEANYAPYVLYQKPFTPPMKSQEG